MRSGPPILLQPAPAYVVVTVMKHTAVQSPNTAAKTITNKDSVHPSRQVRSGTLNTDSYNIKWTSAARPLVKMRAANSIIN